MNDAIVMALGFESLKEFNRMVASVDLSSPEKVLAFRRWQNEDGSREGLAKLPAAGPAS